MPPRKKLILNLLLQQASSVLVFAPQLNALSADPTKWSNTLKEFVDEKLTICLSVLDHFVGLALKGLIGFF